MVFVKAKEGPPNIKEKELAAQIRGYLYGRTVPAACDCRSHEDRFLLFKTGISCPVIFFSYCVALSIDGFPRMGYHKHSSAMMSRMCREKSALDSDSLAP